MNYSVCVPAVLGKMGVAEALRAVKKAGFSQYEIWSWWDQDVDAYKAAQEQEQLSIAALCTRFIPLTDPACREAYVIGVRETAEVCRKLGCKTIISQVGNAVEGVSRQKQHDSIAAGLRECLPVLREHDLTLVIEPLNTRIDHIGYYLWKAEEGFEIVDELGDEHVKVLYDMYHQYVMGDLQVPEIVENIRKIGHFHMAGFPGRHEPMVNSDVDYPEILAAIKASGYAGSIGQEYFPVKDAEEGLKELFGQLAAI